MTCTAAQLKAPFPWFGGKSATASEVWARLGEVPNYVEPFFGSGAVLLARPPAPPGKVRTETVNDADGLPARSWRALKYDPETVAEHADWPVNEADLHARHLWLVREREPLTDRLMADPGWCDAKAAGWWVWGACAWIGSGWCSGDGPWTEVDGRFVNLGNRGQGVNRQLPHLGNRGQGVNRQLPHLGDRGRVWPHLAPLAERLRGVRVACGDWARVCGRGPTSFDGGRPCGVYLDPPYGVGVGYSAGSADVWRAAWDWACESAAESLRIVVSGYEDGRTAPEGWRVRRWDANHRERGAGYGNAARGQGRTNAAREVLWVSPHCIPHPEDEDPATGEKRWRNVAGQLDLWGASR